MNYLSYAPDGLSCLGFWFRRIEAAQTAEETEDMIYRLQKDLVYNYANLDDEPELLHHFAPGVYAREIIMETGRHDLVIGAKHKTKHFNIVLEGECSVLMDYETKEWQTIRAPCIFVSDPGIKKVLIIHKTTRWLTIHPTEGEKSEEDIPELTKELTDEDIKTLHEDARTTRLLRMKGGT